MCGSKPQAGGGDDVDDDDEISTSSNEPDDRLNKHLYTTVYSQTIGIVRSGTVYPGQRDKCSPGRATRRAATGQATKPLGMSLLAAAKVLQASERARQRKL